MLRNYTQVVLIAMLVLGAAFCGVVFPVAAALTGVRGVELIYIAIVGAALGVLYNWFSDALELWFGRRGL